MMEETTSDDVVSSSETPELTLKTSSLSNGTTQPEAVTMSPSDVKLENGSLHNGAADALSPESVEQENVTELEKVGEDSAAADSVNGMGGVSRTGHSKNVSGSPPCSDVAADSGIMDAHEDGKGQHPGDGNSDILHNGGPESAGDDPEKEDVGSGTEIRGNSSLENKSIPDVEIICSDDDDELPNKPTAAGTREQDCKEGTERAKKTVSTPGVDEKCQNVKGAHFSLEVKNESHPDRGNSPIDGVEIVGETKLLQIKTSQLFHRSKPGVTGSTSTGDLPRLGHSNKIMPALTDMQTAALALGPASSPAMMPSLRPALGNQRLPALTGSLFPSYGQAQVSPVVSMLMKPAAPPKPRSSLDQIELIRWEIQNRVNSRPKYFKPNPASELGHLAKFLFDIGSDLIREAVYHDLVKIQSKKKDAKLSDKEKADLEKLKEIEKELYATIGHLKLKLKKRCKMCNFQTESVNVMFNHNQYPHEDNRNLKCAFCTFVTKQTMAFKFHMEAEHAIPARLNDKKAFYECDLCPYENNQENKLTLHKQRCLKQFRPFFNLHPSCLSGAEINLCLENIFYKPLIPKNVKFLQQKYLQQRAAAQQQAVAQAEAKKLQAQMQMQALAAQKNATQNAAKPQQKLIAPTVARQYVTPPQRIPVPQQRAVNTPGARMILPKQRAGICSAPMEVRSLNPAAALVNAREKPVALPTPVPKNAAANGFEVCEICGGYVKDRKALRIHFLHAHHIDLPFNLFERNQAPLYCATCYVRFWTAQGLRKHIDSHKVENQTRGVVGKCISCGHQVLNMLLHMRAVHGHEMQDYINALMCMFCGIHFNSRQDCEQHILKIHGHVDPATGTLKAGPSAPATQPAQKVPPNQKKTVSNSLVKGSVCVLCNLNFGRNVDLTRHCMRMHHTCMKCGMVVVDKASLVKHICLTSATGTRICSLCGETGFHAAYYVKHLRDRHLKKCSVKLFRLTGETIEQWTKQLMPVKEREEILVEISDSDDDVPSVKRKASPSPSSSPKRSRVEEPASEVGTSDVKPEPGVKADEDVIEVIDLSTSEEFSTAADDLPSAEAPHGEKRKSEPQSPESDETPKRQKSS